MSAATSSVPDFIRGLVPYMLKIYDDAQVQAYRMIWNVVMSFLAQNLLLVISLLVLVLLLALAEWRITGRWGFLGYVLYHYIYAGALLLIDLIFGPNVFANDYFEVVFALLYICGFLITRMILKSLGVRFYRKSRHVRRRSF